MKKRILAAVLWFFAGWCVGAMLAFMVGVSPVLAPIIAVVAASIFAGDPRRIIWTPRQHTMDAPVGVSSPIETAAAFERAA